MLQILEPIQFFVYSSLLIKLINIAGRFQLLLG